MDDKFLMKEVKKLNNRHCDHPCFDLKITKCISYEALNLNNYDHYLPKLEKNIEQALEITIHFQRK